MASDNIVFPTSTLPSIFSCFFVVSLFLLWHPYFFFDAELYLCLAAIFRQYSGPAGNGLEGKFELYETTKDDVVMIADMVRSRIFISSHLPYLILNASLILFSICLFSVKATANFAIFDSSSRG